MEKSDLRRYAKDRTGEVNGLVKVLYRAIDEDGYVTWVCSCACSPTSKFRVRGIELKTTLSCGCLAPQLRDVQTAKLIPFSVPGYTEPAELSQGRSAHLIALPQAA